MTLTVVLVLDVGVFERAVRWRVHGLESDQGEDDGPRVGSVHDASRDERQDPHFRVAVDLAVARDGPDGAGLLGLALAGDLGGNAHAREFLLQ